MAERVQYYDFARFFAIFAVIAVHSAQITQISILPIAVYELGRFGVQLFFAISGATVMMTYQSIMKSYRSPHMVFYLRRFFRLVPLFALAGVYYSFSKGDYIFSTLSPAAALDPYNINNIAGGWSIWNELYFYLVFPAYFLVRDRLSVTVGLSIITVLLSFLINSRFYGLFEDSHEFRIFDYENMFTQFVCFVVGVELAARNFKALLAFILISFVLALGIKVVVFPEQIMKTDYGAAYWTSAISLCAVLFLLLLKAVFERLPSFGKFAIVKWMCKLGRVTYTSYIVHFIIIETFRSNMIDRHAEINIIFVACVTFGVSLLVQRYSEEIWQDLGHQFSLPYRTAPTF